MSIVTRIRIGFGLPLLILALIGAISYMNSVHMPKTNLLVVQTYEVLAELRELTATLGDLLSAQRNAFNVGGAPSEQVRWPTEPVNSHVKTLRQLMAGTIGASGQRLDVFEAALTQWNSIFKQALEVRNKQGVDAGTEFLQTSRHKEDWCAD